VIVQAVADRHGVSTGQLYTWRKEMLATAMAGFVPVEVVPEAAQLPPPGSTMSPDSCVPSGVIEIKMSSGAIWQRVVGMRRHAGRDCREFRVWSVMMGKKDVPHGQAKRTPHP
jgi:hypothetical protein